MKTGLIAIALILLVPLTGFSNQTIHISESTQGLIGDQIDCFIDDNNQYEIGEILYFHEKGEFKKSEHEIIIYPSPIPAYWFSFKLKSTIPQAIWLNIKNSNLSHVELYKYNSNGNLVTEYKTGSLFPRGSRAYKSNTFWFPLIDFEDTNTYLFVIKIKASLTMEAPLEVGTFDFLFEKQQQSDFLAIFFIGATSIMFIYNLFLFAFTRDRIYAYYSFYILTVVFGTTFLNNYPILESFIGAELTYSYTACWLWTNFVGIGLFAMSYLDIKSYFPKVYKLLWVEMGIIVAYGILNFFFSVDHLSMTYQIMVVIFYATCLFTAYYYLWNGRENRYVLYSVGWTIMMLGGIAYLLVINGVLVYTPITRNTMYIGVVCEVLVFSIALAQRLNELKAKQVDLNSTLEVTNQVLKQNNESLDSFNYHVSHDLKTVLNNGNALARMIQKYNAKKNHDKIAEIADKLVEVTKNGAETVQSFLSLGKVDSILQNESKQKLILVDEVKSIIERYNLSEAIKVEIMMDEIVSLDLHQKAFESILLNLLTNSIKYNRQDPKAELFFIKDEYHYRIEYEDNGVGIDLEKYGNELFKPFQRGSSHQNKEGTGVGLYLVKRIVDSYDGHISVESKLGKGTTFTIKLPIN